MMPLALFFLKIALTVRGLLWFHTDFGIVCFCERCHWIFDRDRIDSVVCSGKCGHFNNTCSP